MILNDEDLDHKVFLFRPANFAGTIFANTRRASVPAGLLPLMLWGSRDVRVQLTSDTENESHEGDTKSAGTVKS